MPPGSCCAFTMKSVGSAISDWSTSGAAWRGACATQGNSDRRSDRCHLLPSNSKAPRRDACTLAHGAPEHCRTARRLPRERG